MILLFYFRCQIPDIYKKISKDVCEADANAVDLGRMNKHFYEFGRYVIRFDRVGYIGPMLVDVSAPFFLCIEQENESFLHRLAVNVPDI